MVSMQVFRTMELPTVQGWSENYLFIKYTIKIRQIASSKLACYSSCVQISSILQ